MHYVPFSTTGEQISDIIQGTWKMGGSNWGAVNDLDSIATIKYCIDQGVNLIDTATGYGNGRAERLIQYALAEDDGSRRDKTFVMTKWYLWEGLDGELLRSCSPESQAQALKGCKARLGMDVLDIVLLHRDDEVTPIEVAIEALAGFQEQGHIRWIGASNYSLEHLQRAQKTAPLQMYQPHFSMMSTALRDDGRLDFCRENNISTCVFGVTGRGLLAPRLKPGDEYPVWDPRHKTHRGKDFERRVALHGELKQIAEQQDMTLPQLAAAWALSHEGVTCVIMGGNSPAQAADTLQVSGRRLAADIVAECERIAKQMIEA